MLRPGARQQRWEWPGGWQGRDSRDCVAQEWMGTLDLDGKHLQALRLQSASLLPFPTPTPLRTAAESRALASAPSRASAAREGRGRQGGGDARLPWKAGEEGGEGGRSRGAATRRSRIGGPAAAPARLLGFPGMQQPLPCSPRRGCSGPAQSRVGQGPSSPCPVKRCQVPGFSPRSSLLLRSDHCLREHIPSLLLSCLAPSVPLPTVLPEGQLCQDWLKQVSVTCQDFAALGTSVNLVGGGEDSNTIVEKNLIAMSVLLSPIKSMTETY